MVPNLTPARPRSTSARLLLCTAALLVTASLPLRAQATADLGAGLSETVMSLPLQGDQQQHVLLTRPAHPRGTVVMLPGGAGELGLARDGTLRHGDNFLVRTRAMWAAHGYAVLIPDTIGRTNLRGLRATPAYAAVVDTLVRAAHDQVPGPVFLMGTSQGSIAATNGAAHAAPGQVAGLVLTESVSRQGGSGETVFDADPGAVRVPVLVVANRDDRCDVAPPGDAPRIAAALSHAPDVKVLEVAGGTNAADRDCGSLSPHGYNGIEGDVVGRIAIWLDAHG